MPKKIVLDAPTFKALSAESRIQILKLLRNRKHMQTELAQNLQLAVPTVKEHLTSMEKADLVTMRDEGRKWKYYELTEKGKAILAPEEQKHQLWIAVSILGLGILGGALGWVRNTFAPYYSGESMRAMTDESPAVAMEAVGQSPSVWANPLFIAYLAITACLVGFIIYKVITYKRALRERERIMPR